MNSNKVITKISKLKAVLVVILSLVLILPMNAFADPDDWNYVKKEKDPCAAFNRMQQLKSTSQIEEGSNDGYLVPGSARNQVMVAIYNTLTDTYGFSGAAAIGVLANAQHESGFIEDVAEGPSRYNVPYYGDDAVPSASKGLPLRFGMNNDKPIKTMGFYVDRQPNMLGGGGLFQFTPYTKFTNSPFWRKVGDGWSVENQVAYLMQEVVDNKGFSAFYNAPVANSMKQVGRPMHSNFAEFLRSDDVEKAANSFYAWYERGAGAQNRGIEAKKIVAAGQLDPNKPHDSSKWPDIYEGKSPDIGAAVARAAKEKCIGKQAVSSEFGERIVQIALTRVGGRYVLGANTWGTSYKNAVTDCSGFVRFTLVRAGLKTPLPRVAKDQALTMASWGWEISKDELQAGDVIAWSKAGPMSMAEHIGFYGGENEQYPEGFIVHASNPKAGIKIGGYYDSPGKTYFFRPQANDKSEWGEPDLSDVGPLVDYETAKSRSS